MTAIDVASSTIRRMAVDDHRASKQELGRRVIALLRGTITGPARPTIVNGLLERVRLGNAGIALSAALPPHFPFGGSGPNPTRCAEYNAMDGVRLQTVLFVLPAPEDIPHSPGNLFERFARSIGTRS